MFTVSRFVNTSQLKRSLFQRNRKPTVNVSLSRILFLTGCAYKNLRFASTRGKKMKTMRQLETDKLRQTLPLVYTKTKKRYELLGTLRRPKRAPQAAIFQRRGAPFRPKSARTYKDTHAHAGAYKKVLTHMHASTDAYKACTLRRTLAH